MTRAFRKRVKPRKFQRGDLVLKVLRGLISDPRGKFRPSWSGPYVIRDLTREGAAWLTDLDGNQFIEPVNVDQLKKFYAPVSIISIHFASVFPCVMMMRSRPRATSQSRMRALYDPSHHGSGRHIGSEDELFVVVTYCYICIPVGFSIFFYTHSSFILSLFVCFYPRRSSFHFMNDEFFGVWHYLLGDLGLCFPSFHSPFTPGLHYGPSRKTTLRP
ncbi:hypothetical protein CK203_116670 [Vitis vinifera]|uniref:Uncharacterized protein n=1 Tax=Vitis vinifera TaxID=29760 RepID=A0A438CA37_VITVI|nr:hypothetical protein CK203_116670 [Vitis vinifera]